MSVERELLKECRLMLDNPINGTAGRNLQIRITELFAQPETETEQEPVEDRIARWHRLGYEQGKKASKREPLSDEEIDKGYQESDRNYYDLAFRDGVRFAEKHNGIGGGE
jgi:hypothetical protein